MGTIRQAIQHDVEGVETISQAVWGQSIGHEMFCEHVQNETCSIYVAVEAGQVVGFVSTFLTVDVHHRRRWEVDLLAVHPNCQGKGLGTALIQSVWAQSKTLKADVARALVRTANIASQKAFEHAGYVTDNRVHRLYLWTPQQCAKEMKIPKSITFTPLDTLTYRGLGIEGLTAPFLSHREQKHIVAIARNIVACQSRNNTGALIAVDEEDRLCGDVRKLGAIQGEYCWWVNKLGR